MRERREKEKGTDMQRTKRQGKRLKGQKDLKIEKEGERENEKEDDEKEEDMEEKRKKKLKRLHTEN